MATAQQRLGDICLVCQRVYHHLGCLVSPVYPPLRGVKGGLMHMSRHSVSFAVHSCIHEWASHQNTSQPRSRDRKEKKP